MKPISSSMFPIEPAPWKHADGAQKHVKVPSNTRNVHSEIEKRLKDSELKQSENNLRALISMYISEILLASGLLLEDLASGLATFQLHSSGHLINPELFFFLERTKASSLLSSHRKLIFDLVNEILGGKLALVGGSALPWINSGKPVRKTLNTENLLKELCMEIEQLLAKKSNSDTEEEGDLKNILLGDVICQSESWFGFNGEISGMVLGVERLVFKDLINETVIGEEGLLRSNQQQQQQQQRRHHLLSKKSNVEAKLMGLGPLPDSSSADDVHLGADNNPFLQPLRSNNSNKPTRTSNCVRSSLKDPTSPMKPISSSRFLIEPAPWRHADGTRWEPPKHVNVPSKNPNSFPSIYSEIEKRLKDLEFKQSGKDLRALKHILEAMQAKGLLETDKEEEETANLVSQRDCEPKCTSPGPNLRAQRSLQSTRVNTCSEDGAAVIEAWCSGDENKALGRLDDAYVAPGREISHTHLQRILVGRSNQLDVQLHSSNASGLQPNSRSRDEFQRHSPNYYGDLQQCLQSTRVNTCSEDGAAVIEAWYSGDENKALGRLDDAYVAPGREISHTHLQRILVGRSNQLDVQLHSSNASGLQPNSRSRDEFQRHSPNYYGDLQQCLQSTRVNTCSEDGAAVIEAWYSGDENKALGRLDDAYVAPGREISHTHLQRILVGRSNQLDVQLHSSNASGLQPNSRSRDEFQRHSPNYYGDLQQCLQSTRVNTCSEDGAAVIEAWYSGDENKALGRLDDAYVSPGLEISHTHLQRILVRRSNQLDVQLHSSNASGFQPNSRGRDEFQQHSPNYYGDLQQFSATSRKYSDLI